MKKFGTYQKYIYSYLIIYLFFYFLIWCSPLSNDDYEFLSLKFSSVNALISYILQYGNGRFLGNLSGILLIHFPVASFLFRALMLSSIVFLVPFLLGKNTLPAHFVSFLLFVMLDPGLFGQVYLWSSGFYNYIPPVWMSLVILAILRLYTTTESELLKITLCLIVFLLGIASQLYVEHTTIINIFLSVFLTLNRKIMRQDWRPFLLWTASTIIGACIMFSIPILFYVEGNRSEGYRSYNFQNIIALIISCGKNALRIGNHYSGMNAIPLGIGTLSTIILTHKECSVKFNRILFTTSLLCIAFLLFEGLAGTNMWYGDLAIIHHCLKLIIVALLFTLWCIACIRISNCKVRYTVCFLLLMSILSLAPLLVVSPVPMRTVFQANVFLNAATILCLFEIIHPEYSNSPFDSTRIIVSICLSAILVLSSVFIGVKFMVNAREKFILQEINNGSEEIAVFRIPYPYFTWDNTGSFKYHFFREKQGDTHIYSIDYTQWMNDYYSRLK